MSIEAFANFTKQIHNVSGSGTATSYVNAIKILDNIFLKKDVFGLGGKSLTDITNPVLAEEIKDFVKSEERNFKTGQESIFIFGNAKQTSYPSRNFCSAAMACLCKFISYNISQQAVLALHNTTNKNDLIQKINQLIGINKTQTPTEVQQRIGQNVFRSILLDIYGSQCCLCGLDVPETLRASHIVAWADDKKNRLNPENGLCLSATYDAAFDKHLISFDEKYRMFLSPQIRDYYTSDAFNQYFRKMEGVKIKMPSLFLPNQSFLQIHRDKLII